MRGWFQGSRFSTAVRYRALLPYSIVVYRGIMSTFMSRFRYSSALPITAIQCQMD